MEQQCFSSSKNHKKPLLIFHKIFSQSYEFELSLKWYEGCLLTVATTVTFKITNAKFYVQLLLYQQKTIQNYQNYLAKDLKDQFIGINIR